MPKEEPKKPEKQEKSPEEKREELLAVLRKSYPGVPDEQLIEESNGLI